jgi:hypothetical protein
MEHSFAHRNKSKQRMLQLSLGFLTVLLVIMLRAIWLHPLHLRGAVCKPCHEPEDFSLDAFNQEIRSHALEQLSPEHTAWKAAAHANLTAFKATILEAVQNSGNRPFKREMWSMFAPVVSCPPGRPLKRYPDAFEEEHHGDGQKLLCSLEEEEAQTVGCVIYSMGSNGGLPVLC